VVLSRAGIPSESALRKDSRMPKEDVFEAEGTVLETLPTPCPGRTGQQAPHPGHISGKMRKHFIRILPATGPVEITL